MNKTQRILFRLMEDFDKICQDNGLEYFIGGGTALGALRNSGFLAWDDDVDLFVTYETHLKLNEIMSKIDMPDRKWVSEENTPYFWNPIARFFDLTTTDFVKDKLHDGTPSGHCLELFTLDPYPNTEEEQKNYHKYLWLYTEINNPRFLSANLSMPEEMIDRDLYYYYRDMMKREGRKAAIADIFKHMSYPEEECDYYCARWSYRPLVFRKEWVKEKTPIQFEGRTFPAATGIIRQMISNYNSDWNIIPTKGNRQTHPSLENTKMSYRDHEQAIRELCDSIGYNTVLHENTEDRLERVFSQFDLQKEVLKVRAAYMEALAAKLGEKKWKYDDSERSNIGKELQEYLSLCFTRSYKKFKYPIPMNDDLRDTIFYYLVYSNRRDDAIYFADLYKDCDNYPNYSRINYCLAEMKIARYEKNVELTGQYLKELNDKWDLGDQLEVERTKMWLVTQRENEYTLEDIDRLKEELNNATDRQISKYFGDIALRCGDKLAANEYYRKVYPSRNGVLITEMHNKGFFPGPSVTDKTIRYLDLLKEFDDICKMNGIEYVVGRSLAMIDKQKKFYNISNLCVFMRPNSMVNFLEYCLEHKTENRAVEYYGNNPDYPAFSMHYVDTSTTALDAGAPERYKMNGICIEIIPLRGFRPSNSSFNYLIEKAQLLKDRYTRAYISSNYRGLKRLVVNCCSNYMNSISNKARHRIFCRMCDYYDKETGSFWILDKTVHFKRMSTSYLKRSHNLIILGDYTVRVPNALNDYMKFLKNTTASMGYTADIIIDGDISYSEITSRIENSEYVESIVKDIVTEYDQKSIALDERDNDITDTWENIIETIDTEEQEA